MRSVQFFVLYASHIFSISFSAFSHDPSSGRISTKISVSTLSPSQIHHHSTISIRPAHKRGFHILSLFSLIGIKFSLNIVVMDFIDSPFVAACLFHTDCFPVLGFRQIILHCPPHTHRDMILAERRCPF